MPHLSALRKQLVIFVLKTTGFLSICLGLLPFKYNARAQRLEHSTATIAYSVGLNVAVLGALVLLTHSGTPFTKLQFLTQRSLNTLLNAVNIYLSLLTLLVVLYSNWRHRRRLLETFTELTALRRTYFAKRLPSLYNCATFDRYVLLRGVVHLLQIGSVLYKFYVFTLKWQTSHYLLVMCLVFFTLNILYLTENHFCLVALYIYRYLWTLNCQLRRIHVDVRRQCGDSSQRRWSHAARATRNGRMWMQRCCDLADEVDNMLGVRKRLLHLSAELMELYGWQVLMVMLLFISTNVVNLFYLCVFWSGKLQHVNSFTLAVFVQAVLIKMLDMHLLISCCGLALQAAMETSCILRHFNEFPHLEARLATSLNALALHCGCYPLRFSICGFFNLYYGTGYQVGITTFMYLIFLIQFDFMNL